MVRNRNSVMSSDGGCSTSSPFGSALENGCFSPAQAQLCGIELMGNVSPRAPGGGNFTGDTPARRGSDSTDRLRRGLERLRMLSALRRSPVEGGKSTAHRVLRSVNIAPSFG